MADTRGRCHSKYHAVTSTFSNSTSANLFLLEFTRMQATNKPLTINNTGVISYFKWKVNV